MLFNLDNHSSDRPEYTAASNEDAQQVYAILEKFYPNIAKKQTSPVVETIGAININSQNYRVGNYYVKLIKTKPGVDYVPTFETLNATLFERAIPVPSFTSNVDGSKITLIADNAFVYVQPFLDANFYTGTSLELQEACAVMQKMTSALVAIQPTAGQREPYASFEPAQVVSKVAGLIGNETEFDRLVKDHLQLLDRLASEYHEERSHLDFTTLQHYDLHPHNLFFKNQKLVAVLDLESFRAVPKSVALGFNLFKLGRKSVSTKRLTIAEFQKTVDQYFDRSELARYGRFELLRRLCTILKLHYIDANTEWDRDISKHLNGLAEMTALFGV